jgi:hypothetical protein
MLSRRGYKGLKYEKMHVGSETESESETVRKVGTGYDSGSLKNHFGSIILLLSLICMLKLWFDVNESARRQLFSFHITAAVCARTQRFW